MDCESGMAEGDMCRGLFSPIPELLSPRFQKERNRSGSEGGEDGKKERSRKE